MTVIGPRGLVLVLVGVLVSATLAAAFTVAFSGPAVAVGVPAPRATPRVSPMNGPSVNVTLHGNAARGWGKSNATISEPGPPIVVFAGTNVTLTLIANDSSMHNWFIDFDNSLTPNDGEPSSPDFNSGTVSVVVWSFVADRSGNWTYRCRVHPTSMTGSILIIGGTAPPPPGVMLPIISAIMLGALGVV